MKKIFYLIALVAIGQYTIAQKKKPVPQKMSIGQICPDIKMLIEEDTKSKSYQLSDYKGKLVILDFWNTQCTNCIKSFPDMESLQKKFKDRIQILLVTAQSKEIIDFFFSTHRKIKRPDLPMIYEDYELNRMFPHQDVPFHVWIDSQMKFIAELNRAYTTVERIQKFLKQQPIEFPSYRMGVNYDWRQPALHLSTDEQTNGIIFYSYLVPANDSLRFCKTKLKTTGSDNFNHIIMNGDTRLSLYLEAYNEGDIFPFNKNNTVLEVADRSVFIAPSDPEKKTSWAKNHKFLYDLLVPPRLASELYKFMREDLQRFFGYEVCIEKRKMKSQILIRTTSEDLMKTKGGKPGYIYPQTSRDSLWCIQNLPFGSFVRKLKACFQQANQFLHFVDETNYTGKVDMSLHTEHSYQFNLELLKEDLRKYGLDIIEEERWVDCLIIREKTL